MKKREFLMLAGTSLLTLGILGKLISIVPTWISIITSFAGLFNIGWAILGDFEEKK